MKSRRLRRAVTPLIFAASCLVWPSVSHAVSEEDLATYRGWGIGVADEIERTLGRRWSALYAETAHSNGGQSGGVNGYAFVWAAAVQFRVLNSLVEADPLNPNRRAQLRAFSDELHDRYWNRSADRDNGYVVAPGSLERYYDDNAHVVVALAEAYEITGDSRYLSRAILTHDFVLEGEDAYQGGGIHFKEDAFNNKNTISTLQEARGAAMLYQATGQQRFLDDATRLLAWTNSHVQRADGLYYQSYKDNPDSLDHISNIPLINSAGMGILTNLEMYDITGDTAYLEEAQRVGTRAAQYYVGSDNGRFKAAGQWAFELVDAFVDLYEHDGDSKWLELAEGGVLYLHNHVADDEGHYGGDWNKALTSDLNSWKLIDQAAVARAYLYTGLAESPVPEPAAAVLMGGAGVLLATRRRRRT